MAARTDDPTVVPGETIPVTVQFYNRGAETVDCKRVTLFMPEGWIASLPANPPLGPVAPGESAALRHTVAVPAAAKVTEPFWYRESREDTRYKTRPTKNVFAPFDEPEIRYANAPEPAEGVDPRLNEIVFAPLDYALVARR